VNKEDLFFDDEEEINKLELKGSWDDWSNGKMMNKWNDSYYLMMNLPDGKYEYKIIINDRVWSSVKGVFISNSPYSNSIIEINSKRQLKKVSL